MGLHKFGLITALYLFALCGCSSQENAGARGKGKILFNGQPSAQSTVTFHPTGVGSSSFAMTDSEGNFELKTGKSMTGVVPGDYEVSIENWKYYPDQIDEHGKIIANGVSNIPRKYTNPKTSGFTATIKPDVVNEFHFELTGEGEKMSTKAEPQK